MKKKSKQNRSLGKDIPRISDKHILEMLQSSENTTQKPAATSGFSENAFSHLHKEDRILWESVARSTKPLRRKMPVRKAIVDDFYLWDIENGLNIPERVQSEIEAVAAKAQATQITGETALSTPSRLVKQKLSKSLPDQAALHDIDRPTIRKISKGRLEIEARIDLHGMTQREAHDLLYGFLADAWHRGLRFVLVITGKGSSSGSAGILKQAVPQWFSTPLFRIYVSAYEDAVRHHGGHGALYVRLRKTPAEKLAEGALVNRINRSQS